MANDESATFDQALFRAVMASFATGVTVITTQTDEGVRGMTANAFMSGSLDPPLCVVSVSKKARMHAALSKAGHFGVSILTQSQHHLSPHFSGRPRLDLDPAFEVIGGTPVLRDAVATITADIVARHECGDHTLFVGHIRNLRRHGGPPLVIHSGRIASLLYSGEDASDLIADLW
jgi:flavin reductase (DIM6/NTAB) family NADH-FMN oxidoreductase RutF